jgi:GNAT superfamily N-acetyltransferase
MKIIEYQQNEFIISTDKTRLDIPLIHEFLSERSYWAKGRPLDVVRLSIENSLCFGVYSGDQQVGFARVVTDYATFSWLCDFFILETHRGRGLSKWLVATIVEFPGVQEAKRFLLATSNAHDLYAQYGGFEVFRMTEKLMVRTRKT